VQLLDNYFELSQQNNKHIYHQLFLIIVQPKIKEIKKWK
jgi:hypothetical protein